MTARSDPSRSTARTVPEPDGNAVPRLSVPTGFWEGAGAARSTCRCCGSSRGCGSSPEGGASPVSSSRRRTRFLISALDRCGRPSANPASDPGSVSSIKPNLLRISSSTRNASSRDLRAKPERAASNQSTVLRSGPLPAALFKRCPTRRRQDPASAAGIWVRCGDVGTDILDFRLRFAYRLGPMLGAPRRSGARGR